MSEACCDVLSAELLTTIERNPVEQFLRKDRLPHIWCSGCGIGTTVNCFAQALMASKVDIDKTVVVSGIGCTGRVAGHVLLDSFHTTHGRAIPFATGMKLANPELNVVVYSGDGDLFAIGGNHIIHAARRNIDLKVICVNNFTYAMTGGQTAPTTPLFANTSTAAYGSYDEPFNLCQLMDAVGAVYVARWSTFHVKQLEKSMTELMMKKGFGFIEILSPCPVLFVRRNNLGDSVDVMKFYKQHCKIKNGAPTSEVGIQSDADIIIGTFVNRERPTYIDLMRRHLGAQLGDQFLNEGVPSCCA
jgi:2-oxoglutarate ferredoxin oxidoreductase subunit beta